MKYFTPELVKKGQADNPNTLGDVERVWDETCDRYNAYFATIRADLPPGLRQMVDSYYLHDARVRGMGQREMTFVVMVQLDTPPHSLLSLTYDLVEEPTIDKPSLPGDQRLFEATAEWQYDEIEKVTPSTWRQSILLNNGWEVQLHFRDVEVCEAQAILPVPNSPASNPISQSA